MQTTSHLLMIRPVAFGFNEETAVNNSFQVAGRQHEVQAGAVVEFDRFVSLLIDNGVDVTVIDDTPLPHTPDSIFPNNWFSSHSNGDIVLYPMFAVNRRAERKQHVITSIDKKFVVHNTIDMSDNETRDLFLEGTGSMVLDRDFEIAYACLSPRTDLSLLEEYCGRINYKPISFHAHDANDQLIYHTNVLMCVADKFVVICMDAVKSNAEKKILESTIKDTGKEVILITVDQMNHFAGNMLQVQNEQGEKILIMSSQAYHSLSASQIGKLSQYNKIIHSSLETIEANGGGSARCMMAEIFLQRR